MRWQSGKAETITWCSDLGKAKAPQEWSAEDGMLKEHRKGPAIRKSDLQFCWCSVSCTFTRPVDGNEYRDPQPGIIYRETLEYTSNPTLRAQGTPRKRRQKERKSQRGWSIPREQGLWINWAKLVRTQETQKNRDGSNYTALPQALCPCIITFSLVFVWDS